MGDRTLILTIIIGLILLTAPWFFMMARLKNMGYERQDIRRFFDDFGWIVGSMTLTSLVVGVLSDVLFNAIVGTLVFRELPREFLFTDRVKRWDNKAAAAMSAEKDLNYRERMGYLWAARLNRIMPNHV